MKIRFYEIYSVNGVDGHKWQLKLVSVTYLGHYFDFEMSDDKHKSEFIETITDQIEIIDKLPLHPKNKLKLYQQWTLSKVSWHQTVTKISNTWTKNNIDNIVSQYIRLWLEIPVIDTLNIVTQSKRKF